jgi:hypothetical protein
MSHPPPQISIPNGTYPAVSIVDAVHRLPGGITFTMRWRVDTPFGEFETEDADTFVLSFEEDGDLKFRGRDFSRMCALLNAAKIPGLPIRKVPDITKLSGVRADVHIEDGKAISVGPFSVKA